MRAIHNLATAQVRKDTPSLIDVKSLGRPKEFSGKEGDFQQWSKKTEAFFAGVINGRPHVAQGFLAGPHPRDQSEHEPQGDIFSHAVNCLKRRGIVLSAMHNRFSFLDLQTAGRRILDCQPPCLSAARGAPGRHSPCRPWSTKKEGSSGSWPS